MASSAFVDCSLEREKENAKNWLRNEMDLLVESMFAQMKTKFANSLSKEFLLYKL